MPGEPKEKCSYFTADQLFASPEPSSSFEEIRKSLADEAKQNLLDPVQLREQEDWNYLANKIVGAEDLQET